jgi:hypothetical protein
VLEELRPLYPYEPTPEEDERECRIRIEFALERIASSRSSQGQAKERLSKFSKNVARMIHSAGDLPWSAREKFGISDKHLAELRRWSKVSGQWSDKIKVKKTSGSTARGEKMQLAAGEAMSLLYTCAHKRPTSTRGGLYVRITELLHEIATGRHGSAENACRYIIRQQLVWPDFMGELKQPDWERSGEPLLPPPPSSRKSR